MKLSLALAGTLILGSSLTACGDNGAQQEKERRESARVQAYCASLKAAAPKIKAYDEDDPDFKKLQGYFDVMRSLAKKAPAELHADWNIVDYDIAGIERAAVAANIKLAGIPKLVKHMPKSVNEAKLPDFASAFTDLKRVSHESAISRIATHAAKVCKVDLTPNSN